MDQNLQNRYLIPLAIVVAGVFIAGAIYYGGSTPRLNSGQATSPTTELEIAPVTDRDHIVGSRNAKLVIVEYSDTECPFCKVFHNTMKEVVSAYGGQVAWVYRHFPIAQLHAKASKEAEATECAFEMAGNQGFWSYINRLFEVTNSNDSLDPSELPKIAKVIGFDETLFSACLLSGRYAEPIKKSVEEAVKAGARGTPYSVIISKDGKKVVINGAEPIGSVKAKIDGLLR